MRINSEDKWIFLGITLTFFYNFNSAFYFMDGHFYSTIARNMLETGNWLVPTFTTQWHSFFSDHPPFFIMLQALVFKVFGISWASGRILPATFSAATVICLYYFLKNLGQPRWAFFSAFVLMFCPYFVYISRSPTIDPLLTFFISLTYFISYFAIDQNSRKYWVIAGITFGAALLIKGPHALSIPLSLLIYSLFRNKFKEIFSNPWPWYALLIGFLIFSIWPILLFQNQKFFIFERWFDFQIIQTLFNSRGETSYDTLDYVKRIFIDNPLWVILFVISFTIKKSNKISNDIIYFSSTWFFLFFITISIIKLKFPHYVLPIYPAFAIIIGYFFVSLEKHYDILSILFKTILIGISLFFFIFPKPTKDQVRVNELVELTTLVEYFPRKPKNWDMFLTKKNQTAARGELFDRWTFYDFIIWKLNIEPRELIEGEFDWDKINSSLIIVNHNDFKNFENLFLKYFNPIYTFKGGDPIVLLSKDLNINIPFVLPNH